MDTAAIVLAAISAGLEIWGVILTIAAIRKAREELGSFLQRPRRVYASARMAASFDAAATLQPLNQTLDQRIDALEAWQRGLPDELRHREARLTEQLTGDLQGAINAVEKTADDQLLSLREYIAGSQQSFWNYKGPLIIGVGIVVGLVSNIVSALSS